MAKSYKLEHFAKGTGATVVPTDDDAPRSRNATRVAKVPVPRAPRRPATERTRWATPLPPGHVRKKATGEIGRVQSVDPRAGTAAVHWLREGRTSTVPLTAVTRR